MMIRPIASIFSLTIGLLLSHALMFGQSNSGVVRILSSNGVQALVESLEPAMEKAVGKPLSIEFTTAATLKRRIDGGEAFDVAILTPALIDDLIKQGKAGADTRVNFARVGVGVGAKAGTPKQDISTPEALKRTMLNAKSVTYTGEGQSRTAIDNAFTKLGIAEQMKAKTVLVGPGQARDTVLDGKAELVMLLVSEIMPFKEMAYFGPFPSEVQGYVTFTGASSSTAADREGAQAVLQFLARPENAAAVRSFGMEPVTK